MPDFLTRRNGTWHFVRRVPSEFASFDRRGIIKHSTRIRIAQDRSGRRAERVAEQLNRQLEIFWKGLSDGRPAAQLDNYENARRRARALGFEYIENGELLKQPPDGRLERLEALVANGLVNDPGARAALLGTEKRPAFKLSRLFDEYEELTKDEVMDYSPNQLRVFTNGRKRALDDLISVVGDKLITDLTNDDAIDFCEWWRERVRANEVNPKTANKGIGQVSRMLKEVSVRQRLAIPDIFRGLRLKGEVRHTRAPFDTQFIRERLLSKNALAGLNDEARLIFHVVAELGMRPSEVANLQPSAIVLDAEIPHVKIFPDGRRLKTADSERDIPLVGWALEALKNSPQGFPRYRDKSSSLSATVNKYLRENELRPTKDHTVYSLRHSFKDRLIAAEAPDSLIDSLMGHRTYKPKYGRGPSLELKLKYLLKIALKQ